MLVLSRKPHQDLVISGPCVIRVISVSADRARLGILADRSTLVSRSELLVRQGTRGLLWEIWQRLTGRFAAAPRETPPADAAATPAA